MSERAVLVPGNDLDAPFYAAFVRALDARGVSTAVAALPGWAGAPPLPEPGWPSLVNFVHGAVDGALATGGTLMGHSLGALSALLVAARGLPTVHRLVLIEPIIAPARTLAAALAKAYLREHVLAERAEFRNGDSLFRRIHDPQRFPRDAIARFLEVRRTSDRHAAAALFRGLADLYPLPLDRICVPTLILRGTRSGVFARIAQPVLAARIRGARTAVLPGAGHWVANEADDAAADAIAAFIRPGGAPA